MVADPSTSRNRTPCGCGLEGGQRGRQTTLARYTGLPRVIVPLCHPSWRHTEPQDLIGDGPSSGLEDGDGGQFNGDSEKGRGEDSKNGESLSTTTPSEG